MGVAVRADREGDRASLVLTGPFDLAHATAVAEGVEAPKPAGGCGSSMSTCRSSIVSTAPAQSYWRGFSIGWTRISAARASLKATTPSGTFDRPLSRAPGDRPTPQSSP